MNVCLYSPCLSKVNHDIENRKKDLLNPTHRYVCLYIQVQGSVSVSVCLPKHLANRWNNMVLLYIVASKRVPRSFIAIFRGFDHHPQKWNRYKYKKNIYKVPLGSAFPKRVLKTLISKTTFERLTSAQL